MKTKEKELSRPANDSSASVRDSVLAYPFVSDALNNYLDQQIISHYQQQAVKENKAVMAKIQKDMTKKNQQLAKRGGNPVSIPLLRKRNQ